jgi:hypothetical protein
MQRLSKSRFMAGWQCHKLLWWKAHEPDAQELKPDVGLQDIFDQGTLVGEEARKLFPGGVLIDLPHNDPERVPRTRAALASGAPAVFEATFLEDDVFVAVDVLLRGTDGFTLIEVKSSSALKDEHIPDAAIQAHVLRKAGVDVRRIEVMHLSKQYRHPGIGDLFVREDVTAKVEALLPEVPGMITDQLAAMRGSLPGVAIGRHCSDPRECPFWDRCWPQDRFHVTRLYRGGDKGLALMRRGIDSMADIPPSEKLTDTQKRQKLSAERDGVVVQPTLTAALQPFSGRLGFLDFETIGRAIPVWPGTKPWQQTVVQFSYHEAKPRGGHSHVGWLAEGPEDPRDALATAMLDATKNAEKIVMYSSFERSRIRDLQEALPHRREELVALEAKLIDLLPVMQQNVYHPDFKGSFSLKYALTPLVPELTYTDLMIQEGRTASVEIWRLLFVAHLIPEGKRAHLRKDLLAYCERDTLAMVKLLDALRALAGPQKHQLHLL